MAAPEGLAIAEDEPRHEPATQRPPSSRGTMDWDGVRVFLAVAREGSMRAAGRALGLSQPTIARRLAAFEAGFDGQPLLTGCPKGGASTLPVSNSSARLKTPSGRCWRWSGGARRPRRC
jgi:hypothetical protein